MPGCEFCTGSGGTCEAACPLLRLAFYLFAQPDVDPEWLALESTGPVIIAFDAEESRVYTPLDKWPETLKET